MFRHMKPYLPRRAFLQTTALATVGLCLGPNLGAQTVPGLKGAVPVNLPELFARQNALIKKRRTTWLARAAQATPKLQHRTLNPVALVKPVQDSAAFQGWRMVRDAEPATALNRPLVPGDVFILDFGEHLTGYLTLSLRRFDIPVDAPVRLALVFGETPAEVAEPLDPYPGTLARSWMQDETVNIDVVPGEVRLPRRYAFRYVKITVVAASRFGRFGFADLHATAVTTADSRKLRPLNADQADWADLDRVALNTLRDCMQTVFEDGPKRDRRLWLGDLRLQALANYATFRQMDLVKRCLYLLAGTANDDGLVATNAFEQPVPVRGGDAILDYTALFAPTVLEYLQASGDRKTAEDLWPLVLKQLDFTLGGVGADGLFEPPKKWWLFVDWHPTLDKQAPEQGIILLSLRATLELARRVGKSAEAAFLPEMITRMEQAARTKLWDEAQGCFVSGPQRQVSWIAQAWLILAGVPTPEQARRAWQRVLSLPEAEKPRSPYAYHYVVEGLIQAGMKAEATRLLRDYWGGMLRKGADTFWEIYVPENELESPYKSHLINSYCHAWSCTPTYFIRQYPVLFADAAPNPK
jgi:hypothetical protein